jgi:hypothetical protein
MIEPHINTDKLIVLAICIIGFINATQMLNLILSPMSKQIGSIYPLYFSVSIIASLVCLVGLWFLKRWATWVYMGLLVGNQLVLVAMGFWSVGAAIVPLILMALLFKQLPKMAG